MQYGAEALQLPRSSLSSNARYENQVEHCVAYHRGLGPEDALSCKDDDTSNSDHHCDCDARKTPPGRRRPRSTRMFRALEASTWSRAPTATISSEDDDSNLHKIEGVRCCCS